LFKRWFATHTLLLTALLVAAPAAAGTLTLAWDANPETNIVGYRIAYGTTPGSHPTVVDVGTSLTWQIRGLQDGQKYYLVVMAYNSNGLVSDPSDEVAANVTGLTALVGNGTMPAPTGQPISWKALAATGTGTTPYEFRFWRYSQVTGVWTSVQDYSTSNTYTWTPAAAEEGTYAVQAWARVQGSTENYESYRSTGMFAVANGPIKVGALESNIALPASVGASITWTAKAEGGPAPLQYSFWRYDERTGAWVQAQAFGASNTYTWTPAANDLGRHAVQVWVKGAGSGAATFDAYRGTGFFDVRNAPLMISALSSDVRLPVGVGQPITWKATAAGGPGGLEYQFWRFSTSGNWVIGQPWGNSNSYTWTPSSTGSYAVQVWIRRQGQTPLAGYEAYRSSGVFQVSNSTPAFASLTSDVAAPFGANAPVTFTANATGGPGPLQYRFWLYNQARDTWSMLSDYNNGNSVTWIPGNDDAGTYALQAWVRRPASSAQYDAWQGTGFFQVGNFAPTVKSLVSDGGAAVRAGTPITATATSSGGPGRLEYRFWRYSVATGQWSMVQDYSWDRTVKWVPGSSDTGNYMFAVWVRRPGATSDYEAYLFSDPFQVIP
jgi:Fibronectin type III domain